MWLATIFFFGAGLPVFVRGPRTYGWRKIPGIDNDARAAWEHHGLIRLNDDEIEQCRLYVLKKLGQPVIVHRVEEGTIVSV